MAICCERHWKIIKKEIRNLPRSMGKWRKEICLGTPGKSRLGPSLSAGTTTEPSHRTGLARQAGQAHTLA
eukprot:428803-Prymnesium_polylepis.1